MDKDSVILKYLQNETENCDKNIKELTNINDNNTKRLNKLDSKVDKIYTLLNKKKISSTFVNEAKEVSNRDDECSISQPKTYDELFMIAKNSLINRGIDINDLDYHKLVGKEQLKEIIDNLNRPLEKRVKWTKNDFIAVFIAASIGSLVDFILSNRENKFTGKDSKFAEYLDKFHKHDGGGPIDYQGKGFGGGFHRSLSKGHDILRFVEAIIMFKTGKFEGVRYINGVAHKVVSNVNQYGTAYEQLGWIEAIVKYAQHMFADLFSSCSLPFPGSSFLFECNNRELRKFTVIMYQNGFNLKNIMSQSLSTIIVEIILRIYFGIGEVKRYKNDIEIKEDYSNFKAINKFVRPSDKDKLYEMLLLAHTIITAINVGKVAITKKPWEINVTEIISVIRYSVPVLNNAINRHSEYAKLIRSADEINKNWESLKCECSIDNITLEFPNSFIKI